MKVLIPLVMVLVGLAGGAGGGWFMRPAPQPPTGSETASARAGEAGAGTDALPMLASGAVPSRGGDHETLRLPNQFLVPLVNGDGVRALVVIGLALELEAGNDVSLSRHEARLSAVFLQALFDHANIGGFEGVFTSGEVLLSLRRQLRALAREQLGDSVRDVLITELMRQEV